MTPTLAHVFLLAAAGAIGCAVLIVLLRPLLACYAMARPNARSSHVAPTPQGGGIAVIAATVLVVSGTFPFVPELFGEPHRLAVTFAAALGLAIVGITDDVRPLEALPRLILQAVAVAMVIGALPETLRIVPLLPWWIERAVLLIAGVWFVNLVNFMDGADWMMVAEIVPITSALAVFGLMGELPPEATAVDYPVRRHARLCSVQSAGGAPVSRRRRQPADRALVGWLLLELAGRGHLAAALLLPLYFLADSTVTLVRRAANKEMLSQAHRDHYYQRALDRGRGVYRIVGPVLIVNVILAGLAAASLQIGALRQLACLLAGLLVVAGLLADLNRKPAQR